MSRMEIPKEKLRGLLAFLYGNKLATVLLFLLLLLMIVTDTSVTAFGFDLGFKSKANSVECLGILRAERAAVVEDSVPAQASTGGAISSSLLSPTSSLVDSSSEVEAPLLGQDSLLGTEEESSIVESDTGTARP